jgi:hypothetical protein
MVLGVGNITLFDLRGSCHGWRCWLPCCNAGPLPIRDGDPVPGLDDVDRLRQVATVLFDKPELKEDSHSSLVSSMWSAFDKDVEGEGLSFGDVGNFLGRISDYSASFDGIEGIFRNVMSASKGMVGESEIARSLVGRCSIPELQALQAQFGADGRNKLQWLARAGYLRLSDATANTIAEFSTVGGRLGERLARPVLPTRETLIKWARGGYVIRDRDQFYLLNNESQVRDGSKIGYRRTTREYCVGLIRASEDPRVQRIFARVVDKLSKSPGSFFADVRELYTTGNILSFWAKQKEVLPYWGAINDIWERYVKNDSVVLDDAPVRNCVESISVEDHRQLADIKDAYRGRSLDDVPILSLRKILKIAMSRQQYFESNLAPREEKDVLDMACAYLEVPFKVGGRLTHALTEEQYFALKGCIESKIVPLYARLVTLHERMKFSAGLKASLEGDGYTEMALEDVLSPDQAVIIQGMRAAIPDFSEAEGKALAEVVGAERLHEIRNMAFLSTMKKDQVDSLVRYLQAESDFYVMELRSLVQSYGGDLPGTERNNTILALACRLKKIDPSKIPGCYGGAVAGITHEENLALRGGIDEIGRYYYVILEIYRALIEGRDLTRFELSESAFGHDLRTRLHLRVKKREDLTGEEIDFLLQKPRLGVPEEEVDKMLSSIHIEHIALVSYEEIMGLLRSAKKTTIHYQGAVRSECSNEGVKRFAFILAEVPCSRKIGVPAMFDNIVGKIPLAKKYYLALEVLHDIVNWVGDSPAHVLKPRRSASEHRAVESAAGTVPPRRAISADHAPSPRASRMVSFKDLVRVGHIVRPKSFSVSKEYCFGEASEEWKGLQKILEGDDLDDFVGDMPLEEYCKTKKEKVIRKVQVFLESLSHAYLHSVMTEALSGVGVVEQCRDIIDVVCAWKRLEYRHNNASLLTRVDYAMMTEYIHEILEFFEPMIKVFGDLHRILSRATDSLLQEEERLLLEKFTEEDLVAISAEDRLSNLPSEVIGQLLHFVQAGVDLGVRSRGGSLSEDPRRE